MKIAFSGTTFSRKLMLKAAKRKFDSFLSAKGRGPDYVKQIVTKNIPIMKVVMAEVTNAGLDSATYNQKGTKYIRSFSWMLELPDRDIVSLFPDWALVIIRDQGPAGKQWLQAQVAEARRIVQEVSSGKGLYQTQRSGTSEDWRPRDKGEFVARNQQSNP